MTALPPPIANVLGGDTKFEESTLQGYRSAWRDLLRWARENEPGESSLGEEELPPPALIAEYLRARMDLSWSTLTTRRQAIRFVYGGLGEEDPFGYPDVEEVWDQIVEEKRGESARREKRRLGGQGHSPADIIERGPDLLGGHLRSEAIAEEDLVGEDNLKYLPEESVRSEELSAEVKTLVPEPAFDLTVLRDRAILLLVATTDRPRKSLVGIDLEDIRPPTEEGGPTRIVMYNAAGDPDCALRLETGPEVRYCPNRAVAAWIMAAGLERGPLFRPFNPRGGIRGGRIRPQTLNLVVKRWAEEAGLDPGDWSTSTLRER